ncbi:hypothetical protein QFC22_003736 [Naganishia vaughanmartiniae]|uniref:Uncharacterized protein n=1 Tax=Naganishia vaughanmartiniae TaxID=1424756 RepID=A0ACC2X5D9_9TREE|nr:hypothetical protein QFC22_003736 [Naganishia vaughanmartiniae]
MDEWEKSKDVGEAFSPARRLQDRIALPVHETTHETIHETVNGDRGQGVQRVAEGMMLEGLGSPFDSQRRTRGKRKADDLTHSDHDAASPSHANTKTPLPPGPPPRQPTLLDYVPVNDLPEWEWWYEPAPPAFPPESAGQQSESQSQSQSQSIRESLRRSWNSDNERAPPTVRQTGIGVSVSRNAAQTAIATRTGTSAGNEKYRHEQVNNRRTIQMASYITDPSIAPTPTPSSNSHNQDSSAGGPARGTAYEADGRMFRRMPVVLPNLDHERMKLLTNANVNVNGVREAGMGGVGGKATKGALLGGKRGTKAHPQVEGAANKRVMQLQNVQPQRQHRPQQQVRPIKSFLPIPLLGVPESSEGVNNATQDVEGTGTGTGTGNDSIMDMDDISMAESSHMGHQSTAVDISVVESTRVEHHTPVADVPEAMPAAAGHPMIFIEGRAAMFPSPVAAPSKPAGFTPVVLSKAEMDRRRILSDPARYGRHYEIIEEVGVRHFEELPDVC